jgi:hypothetical protein
MCTSALLSCLNGMLRGELYLHIDGLAYKQPWPAATVEQVCVLATSFQRVVELYMVPRSLNA